MSCSLILTGCTGIETNITDNSIENSTNAAVTSLNSTFYDMNSAVNWYKEGIDIVSSIEVAIEKEMNS